MKAKYHSSSLYLAVHCKLQGPVHCLTRINTVPQQFRHKINRLIDHVAQDPCRSYSLDELASLCHISKYHFHRVFKAITGETVKQLCSRLRLEKAAGSLIYNKQASITDIALDYGFSSSTNFSKAFQNHYACSPSHYRNSMDRSAQLTGQTNSNIGKAKSFTPDDNSFTLMTPSQITVDKNAKTYHLAYCRTTGAYEPELIEQLYHRLIRWAESKQALVANSPLIMVNWSDTFIAEQENWTYDTAVIVTKNCQSEGDIQTQTLENRLVVKAHCWLKPSEFSTALQQCWDYLLGKWLADSEYQPAHKPSYEVYGGFNHQGEQSVHLVLPIELIH